MQKNIIDFDTLPLGESYGGVTSHFSNGAIY